MALRSMLKAGRAQANVGSAFHVFSRAMSSKLFVGGLSWGVDDAALRSAFEQYGELTEARVIMDRESGRSKGFGFVGFTNEEEAKTAREAMDGKELNGRSVRVDFATDRPFGGGTRNFNTFSDVIS